MMNVKEIAKEIGVSNAACALDSVGSRDFPSRDAAFLAYLQNTLDTASERKGVSVEEAVGHFVAHFSKARGA